MKKIYLILILCITLNSCGFNLEQKAYNFDNFKETPLWELAQAVRSDDANSIKKIVKDTKLEIDLKDPKFNQTLLVLAIVNNKRNAFLELLNAGADSNNLVGNPKDSSPFIYAIKAVDNCDLYYVENMLKHGANPNLEIKNPQPGHYFFNSFPLLVAIGNSDENGNDCLSLYKLLIEDGANINCCYRKIDSEICEGVLAKALRLRQMVTLKYFVIEKKIAIPDTVTILGSVDKSTQKAYSLRGILNSEEFKFEDFESDGEKVDRSKERRIKAEILAYLDKNKK